MQYDMWRQKRTDRLMEEGDMHFQKAQFRASCQQSVIGGGEAGGGVGGGGQVEEEEEAETANADLIPGQVEKFFLLFVFSH